MLQVWLSPVGLVTLNHSLLPPMATMTSHVSGSAVPATALRGTKPTKTLASRTKVTKRTIIPSAGDRFSYNAAKDSVNDTHGRGSFATENAAVGPSSLECASLLALWRGRGAVVGPPPGPPQSASKLAHSKENTGQSTARCASPASLCGPLCSL